MFSKRCLFYLRNGKRCMCSQGKIVTSKAKELQIPKVSLIEFLRTNFEKWSKRTAVICLNRKKSYTYSELFEKSLVLTEFLRNSLKLKNKETVLIILQNTPEYPIIFLGAAQAGLCISTCNPTYTYYEIKRQITNSNTKLVFTSSDFVSNVEKAIAKMQDSIKIIEISENKTYSKSTIHFEQALSGKASNETIDIKWDDTVALPYSSGTTGLSKGVELTNYNLVANLCQMASPEFQIVLERNDEQEILPAFLPLFHIYGLTFIMLHAIQTGNQMVTIQQFNLKNFLILLKNHKPTVLFAVPLMSNFITNHDAIKLENLKSLKSIVSAAAPLGAADVERFRKKTNDSILLMQAYGMTEMSPMVLQSSTVLPNGIKLGGTGFVYPNTQMKIVAPDGTSTEGLGPDASGELLVKGPQVMKGYYNNPEATSSTFTQDGWLRTGDIAYYDKDEHFFITDRLKELIKVKGYQVAPAELEEVLRDHPSIDDAGVIGVQNPKFKSDEMPLAFVVLKKGASVTAEEIKSFVAERVAKYKQISGVIFVDAIPKNPSGKILRKILRTKV